MRRLLLLMVGLFMSAMSLHADADDARERQRRDNQRVLKVFDANGKLVGRLASDRSGDGVYLDVDGAICRGAGLLGVAGVDISCWFLCVDSASYFDVRDLASVGVD